MYAVFQLSGFQFGAEEGTVLTVPAQKASVGDTLDINDVLLVKKDDTAMIGTPVVAGARIQAEVLSHGKGEHVLIYKYKRRTKYRRTQGHRQDQTEIKIKKIVLP
jgi:large subunit ribosomal protein L21